MKKVLRSVLCIIVLSAGLQAEQWVLDAGHSKLRFTAEARLISADGVFRKFDVKADINEQALEQSQIEVTVDMTTIDTNSERRDNHLKSPDFFDVAKFPTAAIKITGIRKVSDTNYEADADVTIRDVTKQMKLPARILLNEAGILRFRGSVDLNRMEFGVKYNGAMNKIEDVVSVTYELNLRKPRPQGQGAPKK